jgi:hypothetical protein
VSDDSFLDFNTQTSEIGAGQSKRDPTQFEYFHLPIKCTAVVRILKSNIFNFVQHTKKEPGKKKFTSLRCTANSNKTEGRCVGCFYSDSDSGSDMFNTRNLHTLTLIDYSRLHILPTNDEKKKDYRPCVGPRCIICKEGLKPETVGRRHWALGPAHFGIVRDTNLKIGQRCISCRTGTISIINLLCSKCGEPLFTDQQLGSMRDDALLETLSRKYECGQCGSVGMPEEEKECSDCKDPIRASIFDTNLILKKVTSADSDYPTLTVEPTYKFEDIPPEYLGLEPYDFDIKVFPELSLDLQSKIYKVKNPFVTTDQLVEPVEQGAPQDFDPYADVQTDQTQNPGSDDIPF